MASPRGFEPPANVSDFVNQLVAKRSDLVQQAVPGTELIGLVVNPTNPNAEPDPKEARAAVKAPGQKLLVVKATGDHELEAAFDVCAKSGPMSSPSISTHSWSESPLSDHLVSCPVWLARDLSNTWVCRCRRGTHELQFQSFSLVAPSGLVCHCMVRSLPNFQFDERTRSWLSTKRLGRRFFRAEPGKEDVVLKIASTYEAGLRMSHPPGPSFARTLWPNRTRLFYSGATS